MPYDTSHPSILPLPRSQLVDNQRVDPFDILFWTNIHSMGIDSSECLSGVQSLLSCSSALVLVRNFRGNEAQTFINFLDKVLVQSRLDGKLWQRGIRLIRKISKECKIVPSSYLLQDDHIDIKTVRCQGGSATVSDGTYRGSTVAIKNLKMSEGNTDKNFKHFCREIIPWKHMSHSNILPLLGVSISTNPHRFLILTEWMHNGNMLRYSRSNPMANRLELLSGVMSAVTYLHDLKIVHGDLKAANILVDNMGTALVTDFGLMTMTDLSAVLSETVDSTGGTLRWMSPELLYSKIFGPKCKLTRESDRYALGMVIYEVLTGHMPFHHLRDLTFIPPVLRGGRPEKPPRAKSLGFSDALWGLVQLCWSETVSSRPTAHQLLDHLSQASPTWSPPAEYPVVMNDVSSTTDSTSADLEGINSKLLEYCIS